MTVPTISLIKVCDENFEEAFDTFKDFPERGSLHNHTMGDLASSKEEFTEHCKKVSYFKKTPCVGIFLVNDGTRNVGAIEVSPVMSETGFVKAGIFMKKDTPGMGYLAMTRWIDEIVSPNVGKKFSFFDGQKRVEREFRGAELKVDPTNDASLTLCARQKCIVCGYETSHTGKKRIVFHVPPTESPKEYQRIQELFDKLPSTHRASPERAGLMQEIVQECGKFD